MPSDFIPGDALLLEQEVASLPWPGGIFVLCRLSGATAVVALASEDERGIFAIDNHHTMSREDFGAFTPLGVRARMKK